MIPGSLWGDWGNTHPLPGMEHVECIGNAFPSARCPTAAKDQIMLLKMGGIFPVSLAWVRCRQGGGVRGPKLHPVPITHQSPGSPIVSRAHLPRAPGRISSSVPPGKFPLSSKFVNCPQGQSQAANFQLDAARMSVWFRPMGLGR